MIKSYSNFGYEGCIVDVAVDFHEELPGVDIAGIPDHEIKETISIAKEAMEASGYPLPDKRILVSLSPCEIKKNGDYDFAVALAVIAKQNQLADTDVFCIGIMNIRGELTTGFSGVQAGLMSADSAGIKYAVLPEYSREIVEIPHGMKVAFCETLKNAVEAISAIGTEKEVSLFERGAEETAPSFFPHGIPDDTPFLPELSTETAFAVIAAAAGKHNILLWGNDIEQCDNALLSMEHIIPYLTESERRTTNRIQSIAGVFANDRIKYFAPFRIPYHKGATIEGMCGGGFISKPGEVSLAHNGTLLLCDAAEFRSSVLQMLRIPLENHSIVLSRAGRSTVYPADFQLAMTMKPCPCGQYGAEGKLCLCSSSNIRMYAGKVLNPLQDRLDIVVKAEPHTDGQKVFTFGEARKMVKRAVETQRKRGFRNARAEPEFVLETAEQIASGNAGELFKADKDSLGERAFAGLIKLARTFADIAGNEKPTLDDYSKAKKLRNCSFWEHILFQEAGTEESK